MPGIKDGPRNLKQMGAGRGAPSSGLSSSGSRGGMRGAQRSAARQSTKNAKRSELAGSKRTLSSVFPGGNTMVKAAVKSGNTGMRRLTSPSVSARMSKAKTKPSSGRMSSGYKKGPGRG